MFNMAQGKLDFASLVSEVHVLNVVCFGFEMNSLQLSIMRKESLSWNDL